MLRCIRATIETGVLAAPQIRFGDHRDVCGLLKIGVGYLRGCLSSHLRWGPFSFRERAAPGAEVLVSFTQERYCSPGYRPAFADVAENRK